MTTYTSKFYPFNEYDISYERKGICSVCDGEMVNGIRISNHGDFRICDVCFKKVVEHKL